MSSATTFVERGEEHVAIGLNRDGHGPAEREDTVKVVCWCSDDCIIPFTDRDKPPARELLPPGQVWAWIRFPPPRWEPRFTGVVRRP